MAKNEVKYGMILSYILIILNSVYGLIIAPYVLGTIGESEYGVYKTIASMTASVAVLEMGIGGTVQRFLAKYIAQKDMDGGYNFSAMALIQATVLAVAMAIVGAVMFGAIDNMYAKAFSDVELVRAKQLFVVLIAYTVLHIYENFLFGIISGYNKFAFSNTLKILSLIFKIILYLIVLPIVKNALGIVIISLVLEILIIFIEMFYILFKLKHRIKLRKWDNLVFKETFGYTILLFVQSIIIQFNGNIDNMVIGATIGASAVTIYSFAIQMFNMYEQCSTAVSGVVLPTVVGKVYNGATAEELSVMVINMGRVQWSVLGAALAGFICFGKEFFYLWLGEGFNDCYYLALILMVPVTFPLIVNVCLAILKAKNMLIFRTVALAYSALFNVIFTIIGTRYFGYWAAAVGTALSTCISGIVSLNIYYYVKLRINILKIYKNISKRITVCLLVAVCVGIGMNYLPIDMTWIAIIVKAVIFVMIYAGMMFLYGLSKEEKKRLLRSEGRK